MRSVGLLPLRLKRWAHRGSNLILKRADQVTRTVTKFKAAFKATLEEPDHVQRPLESAGHNTAKAGGNRNALQVLCNAWFGTACAVIWRSLYSGEIRWSRGTTGQPVWLEQGSWCVTAHTSDVKRYSRPLVLGAVAFWAACDGDTVSRKINVKECIALSLHTPD